MKLCRKWNFVMSATPSEARRMLAIHLVNNRGGSEFRLCVKGNTFGYEWR